MHLPLMSNFLFLSKLREACHTNQLQVPPIEANSLHLEQWIQARKGNWNDLNGTNDHLLSINKGTSIFIHLNISETLDTSD